MPVPDTIPKVLVGGTVAHPVTGALGTGTVRVSIPRTLDVPSLGYVFGTGLPASFEFEDGVFVGDPPDLPATDYSGFTQRNWLYEFDVSSDVWTEKFYAPVPTTPSTTTLATIHSYAVSNPPPPALYVPLTAVGQPGGPAGPLDDAGKIPTGQIPGGQVPLLPWQVARLYAGLTVDVSTLTPHPDNDPDQPITLAGGTTWVGYHFVCSELIVTDNTVRVSASWVECFNSVYGIRVDANTGLEHDRVFEHCKITSLGVAFSGGSGLLARLCEITDHGDDAFRFGRTHTQGATLEMCLVHNTRPAAGAHADGLQQLTQPAADVHLWGCYFDLAPAVGYTIPPDTGYTGALFADVTDLPIPDDDPEPDRIGGIYADWCYFASPDNYSVVIGAQARVQLTNCAIASGTTAFESVDSTAATSGWGNVDPTGVPLVDTAFTGIPETHLGDLRDVDTSTATTGQALVLATNGTWTGHDITSGGGGEVIVAGFITTGNVDNDNTGGNWLSVAGTEQTIPAAVGDRMLAVYGILTHDAASATYDYGVAVDGVLVRLLGSPAFPPSSGYEGLPIYYPSTDFLGGGGPPPFVATSGDISTDGMIHFCVAHKAAGVGTVFAEDNHPMTYTLVNKGPA